MNVTTAVERRKLRHAPKLERDLLKMCVLLSSTNRTSRASLINYLPAQTSYLKRVELLMEFYIVDNSNKVLIVFGVKKKIS